MTDYTPTTDEVLREKIAATVAVNDLLHSRKTWGDLLPAQKKYYLGVSDALLPIIAEVRTAALEEAALIAEKHGKPWEYIIGDYAAGQDVAAVTIARMCRAAKEASK